MCIRDSPSHGLNQLEVDPSDPEASPFGWHDIDGIEGPEFTITRGNNVWAREGFTDEETSPDGGEDLIFNFNYDFNSSPENMIDATVTNLFYINNIVHDVMYHYGFDEESGNFQSTNYSGQGVGNDPVIARAQDNSDTNNAFFFTAREGFASSMTMFLWNAPDPIQTLTINDGALVGTYTGVPSLFGAPLPQEGNTPLMGELVVVEDDNSGTSTNSQDACDPIINASDISGNIAVIRRGGCEPSTKVLAAQQAGAIGVIVVNNTSFSPVAIQGGSVGTQVTIPSIIINLSDGDAIIAALENGDIIDVSMMIPNTFQLDSSLDNGIVVHEYAHGISSRLTGGPSETNCVFNRETLSEGWSDYYALMFTMTENDLPEDARGIATYAIGEPVTGPGIRPRPYSPDFGINGTTYGDTNNANFLEPHGIGSIWGNMLWDMTWYLIGEYGFDADLYNGIAGNNIALQLVTDGMKLQPCSPGFVDGRDAIFAAIEINTMIPENDREAITCGIRGVFANRGLGIYAEQGGAFNRFDQEENFDAPIFENGVCMEPEQTEADVELSTDDFVKNSFSIFPNPSNGLITLRMKNDLGEGKVSILDFNGRVVFTQNSLLEGAISINAEGLANGVYLLEVSTKTISETVKLIIR